MIASAITPTTSKSFFLDLSRHFLDDRGRLFQDLMPDYLHPNERGYQVWADGMEGVIRNLLGE